MSRRLEMALVMLIVLAVIIGFRATRHQYDCSANREQMQMWYSTCASYNGPGYDCLTPAKLMFCTPVDLDPVAIW